MYTEDCLKMEGIYLVVTLPMFPRFTPVVLCEVTRKGMEHLEELKQLIWDTLDDEPWFLDKANTEGWIA